MLSFTNFINIEILSIFINTDKNYTFWNSIMAIYGKYLILKIKYQLFNIWMISSQHYESVAESVFCSSALSIPTIRSSMGPEGENIHSAQRNICRPPRSRRAASSWPWARFGRQRPSVGSVLFSDSFCWRPVLFFASASSWKTLPSTGNLDIS